MSKTYRLKLEGFLAVLAALVILAIPLGIIVALWIASIALKAWVYARPMDKEGNELDGVWDVSFKVKAEGLDRKSGEKYSNKPKQFDTANPPKAIDVQLRSGAEVKISYTVFPWATAALGYGITLRPKAIQVYKLATSAGADADYYGFGADEDGYEHDDGGASDFKQDDDSGEGYKASNAADDNYDDIPF